MFGTRDPLTAPGVAPELSEKDRAVEMARDILRGNVFAANYELTMLARQLLRALGLSERA
jgi:hypothetical protein